MFGILAYYIKPFIMELLRHSNNHKKLSIHTMYPLHLAKTNTFNCLVNDIWLESVIKYYTLKNGLG